MPHKYQCVLFVLILCVILFGCGEAAATHPPSLTDIINSPTPTLTPTLAVNPTATPTAGSDPSPVSIEDSTRTLLTYDDIKDSFVFDSPIDESAFVMPGNAQSPAHIFEGRLELKGVKENGKIDIITGNFPNDLHYLPDFDFTFVQYETYFIPVERRIIIGKDSGWNILLEPGRVWQEAGDQGNSRVSFPFTLIPKGSNAALNGTMSFVFSDTFVSKVWYQVTQEITLRSRVNMWGLLDAVYHREQVENAEQIREVFPEELAARFPTKPIQQLAVDYPGVDLKAFGKRIHPQNIAWYGFVINDVNYMGGCQTRFGQYTYCESMRAASYSTSKSAFVAVALMRLAQLYGPEIVDYLIRDYVPEFQQSRGNWENVTFNHTLDMATGNYQSAGYMVDDEGEQMSKYAQTQPYNLRIAAAFNWPNREEPGQRWVYRSSDTFILTRAMHNLLQSKEGRGADIFAYVVDEVYRPLNMGPGVFSTLRTEDDNWQGQAEGGYGMWFVADDIAKISTMLNVEGGKIDGKQVLNPDILAATLQWNPADRGIEIDTNRYYNNAFWATHYTEAEGFECDFWISEMLGISGNVVVLMPNGTIYYYFSDSRDFFWESAVRESDKIISMCGSSS